jgi:hypothetical protein
MALAWGEAHLTGGAGDNQESNLWRAVVINAWSSVLDPPPPPEGVDDPFKENTDYHEIIKEAVDVATISLGQPIREGELTLTTEYGIGGACNAQIFLSEPDVNHIRVVTTAARADIGNYSAVVACSMREQHHG